MKSFRPALQRAFALLFFGTGIFAFSLAALFAETADAADKTISDKPKEFNGYLLDATGLDVAAPREPDRRENFESPGVSWRYLYRDGVVNISNHRRVDDVCRNGERSELIQYDVETPGVVVFGHYVDYPTFFNETAPSLWVRSDRPGVALAAIVVFPKTLRPDTNKPLTAILPGDVYNKTGEWQRLTFPKDFDALLDETVRAIRGEHQIPVVRDCAYIRQIALVSEARRGRYSLWLDDLEIAEHIRPDLAALRNSERGASFDPINLLSCRLELSNAPIFWQNETVDSNVYGVEPFGVDRQKVAQNAKKRLQIAEPTPRAAARGFGVPGAQIPAFETPPSFADALAVLPLSNSGGLFAGSSSANAPFGNGDFGGFGKISGLGGVGQVGFLQDATPDARRVAAASYSPDDGKNGASNGFGESAKPSDDETLVSGSGTLANPEDAATDEFAIPGKRLVAGARFRGGVLTTDDKRIYAIRAVEYQGESFEFLKKLGFNAVLLSAPPTASMLRDANLNGVWLLAPPPQGSATLDFVDFSAKSSDDDATRFAPNDSTGAYFNGRETPDAYDPVLMWHMGARFQRGEVDELRQNLAKIRNLDPLRRPIIGGVLSGVDEYSQSGGFDAFLLEREPFLTSLDLNDYGDWLISYQNLATGPNVAFWNRIQTQPAPSATRQRQYFGALESTAVVSFEQMRRQIRLSMRAGCRGLVFSSRSPLDRKDRETQYRAAALELLNLELGLVNPWFASGTPEKTLLKTSAPTLGGVVSRVDRSVLVAPISLEQNAQYATGAEAATDWSATVATKEGYSPDLLVPGALRKIVSKRRAGGTAFSLDDGGMNSLLFFTQSDSLLQATSEKAPRFGDRMAELAIKLAKMRLDLYEQTTFRLQYVAESGAAPKSAPETPNFGSTVADARAAIIEAEKFREQRDYSQAYLEAEKATREIRETERRYWAAATRFEVARPVTPLSTSFYDAPGYLEIYEKINSGKIRPVGPNLIRCGDMESSQKEWADAGWRLSFLGASAFVGSASFESKAAFDGVYGLCVSVAPKDDRVPIETETATAIVETEFHARAGQLICVQGRIKIPNDLTNSVDGVKIYDDQGGEALALRFKNATDWKRFAFYRRASIDGPMRLRFEFCGLGEVWIDDAIARVVE